MNAKLTKSHLENQQDEIITITIPYKATEGKPNITESYNKLSL